ncbi:MAG: pyrroline-5-carboxylate reductase [Calditrichaeota bacterium]|nr:pyrroline-5-carboxylate reductase [Calditrichota bacterium]MCB0267899.1 pyrroline-5-carboxylate reductase [Calditrichota bacterium]MCB0285886.1 pyrroline-5-carboxylate reductase [Calditrichota bacterium]MCB0299366.1 pyrroline-5-carboxylate reductase [Calditrichota bacterium]MCB9067794.1 pyrroline-5-carboxylate reductase [Calditrichia bacterium]
MFRIAIIGCGNMGLTYARSFLQFNLVTPDNLKLVARDEAHKAALEKLDLGHVHAGIDHSLTDSGVIILSVKPQDFQSIAEPLRKSLQPNHVVLSVMAGITIQRMSEALDHKIIVRAMPNTPAQLGMGVTAFNASEGVNIHQISIIDNLLSTTGRTIFLDDESLLDAVTALSGSGPAYFFYLVKCMIDAGMQLGMEESVAAMLVKQTMLGSFHLMNQSPKKLDELIAAVKSKGGTTEAAFGEFMSGKMGETLMNGIFAAQKRARELSGSK